MQTSSALSETQLVSRLAAPPYLRMHSLASSTPWRNASPSLSCAHMRRCCTAEQEQIFALRCSLTSPSSPLLQICCMWLVVSERQEEGSEQRMQWCQCSGRDSVWLAVWESYGSSGAGVVEVEWVWRWWWFTGACSVHCLFSDFYFVFHVYQYIRHDAMSCCIERFPIIIFHNKQ